MPPSRDDGSEPSEAPASSAEASDLSAATDFAVVGIGASAGGIEALIRLFEALPSDSGMAFLVVMHLDPTRDSGLAQLLGQRTAMAVAEATDGMKIEPNSVYVIAPDSSLTVDDGRLRLAEPAEPRGQRYPIDRLFASLAEHRRERAICIVLSGTGSDGTEGLKVVKAQGGCILVQDPSTARFDGMPRSAIDANLADRVLAPEQMPEVLLRYARHSYVASAEAGEAWTADGSSVDLALALLRARAGDDFRHYKRSTLMRRIHRRMGLANITETAKYAELLRTHPAEADALVKDLMISVTGFFRDPGAWKALDEAVLTPLVAEHSEETPVRLWVPACATGQEAYSLAMLLLRRAEAAKKRLDVRVFATDGREDNLEQARSGVYSEGAVATVPADLLHRFFEKGGGTYQVRKDLRELVVFARHNLLRDPPFSRLDLVSCRNLLIYLDPQAQKRAVSLLHFALREGGYLLLGSSETTGRQEDLFETVSKKWRIYRRLGPTRRDIIDFPAMPGLPTAAQALTPEPPEPSQPPRLADLARRALLDRFAPASVLVDRNGRTLWFHGSTGDYLAPPAGEPSRDLLAMARDGLRAKLRSALRDAAGERRAVAFDARIRQGRDTQAIAVVVAPLGAARGEEDLLLVSFRNEDVADAPTGAPGRAGDFGDGKGSEREFEAELEKTRAELQDTIAQLSSANEDLKVANEEVTSMNEELQSTNEELETSKEEMQSFNEELQTVNSQLEHKVHELEEATDTLNNLLDSSEIATVFLDSNLCIRWFSPASKELLELVSSDIGRPVTHFAWKVADEALLRDAASVLHKLNGIDAEVRNDVGRWYLRRLLPYRTHDDRIAGVVISFIDITERKLAADTVSEARLYAETVIETVRHPIVVLDRDLRVQSVNRAFTHAFGCAVEDSVAKQLHELDHGAWDIRELRQLLQTSLETDSPLEGFAIEHSFPRVGRRHMLLNARKLERGGDRAELILLAIEDVTERTEAEAQREILIGELAHRVNNMLAVVQSLGLQTLHRSSTLDGFEKAFEGRVQALARANQLLIVGDWSGAELGEFVRQTMEPYGLEHRFTIEGPRLYLKAKAGMALALILHELATNAVKYGALSNEAGQVQVTWRVTGDAQDRQVRLVWNETGGPPVTAPSHEGFGTTLVGRSVKYQLGGSATARYDAAGLNYEIGFSWQECASAGPGMGSPLDAPSTSAVQSVIKNPVVR